MALVTAGISKVSMSFAKGANKEIGRYDNASSADFPGLNSGHFLARFQMLSTWSEARDRLSNAVKKLIPASPIFFSMTGAILCGPKVFDDFNFNCCKTIWLLFSNQFLISPNQYPEDSQMVIFKNIDDEIVLFYLFYRVVATNKERDASFSTAEIERSFLFRGVRINNNLNTNYLTSVLYSYSFRKSILLVGSCTLRHCCTYFSKF